MKTTINTPVYILEFITQLLKNSNMTNNQLINACLSKYINKFCKISPNIRNAPIQYQPRGTEYSIVHVTFQWNSYDMNRLCRFSQRVSISLLVTKAILLYAEEMVKKMNVKKVDDNYYIVNFTINPEYASQSTEPYKLVIRYRKRAGNT